MKAGGFRIPVNDIGTAVAFYRDELHFNLDFEAPEYGWASISKDDLALGTPRGVIAADSAPQPITGTSGGDAGGEFGVRIRITVPLNFVARIIPVPYR
jgi:hypothetical protein